MPVPLILLLACSGADKGGASPTDSGDGGAGGVVDLVDEVPAGESRAGVITDEAALQGGISAEGRAGDLMLKNDRVQFVVQGLRDGNYYIGEAGGIIDADLVRPYGVPGRDMLDEHAPMATVARIVDAETVAVINDGLDGGAAIVRAEGPVVPLALIQGAVESDVIVPAVDARVQTDYILEPDSWLLRIESRITWADGDQTIEPGDLALVAFEVGDIWRPGRGFDEDADAASSWVGMLSKENDLAIGLFPEGEAFSESPLQSVLEQVGQIIAGIQPATEVTAGDQVEFRRYFGVGPDLATIQAEWLARRGVAVEEIEGTVRTPDGDAVPGARVHLRDVDGGPVAVAVTGADGHFQAAVPEGTVHDLVATGRGDGRIWGVAPGAGWSGPYATDNVNRVSMDSLLAGSSGPWAARGYGVSAPVSWDGQPVELELTPPATLVITTDDHGPAFVAVEFAGDDPASGQVEAADRRITPPRPDGHAAHGYLGSTLLQIPVEPGSYELLVHRGLRYEPDVHEVEVGAGERVEIEASVQRAYETPGVLVADPHQHAAPSNDASATMEQRLLTTAAHGVDIHFGTDHDHVVDYRPLVEALGLSPWLASVVADEVSPPSRGHLNAYPLEGAPDEPNHGAVRWWTDWRELGDTEGLFAAIRGMMGDGGGVIQVNHPTSSGMVNAAGYNMSTGTVSADKWSDDFDAMELLNGDTHDDYFPYYLDMVARGLEPTPVGVSDVHGPDGPIGRNVTFIDLGTDDVRKFRDSDLVDAMAAHATVVSHGPFIDARIDGEWAPGRTVTGPVEVAVRVLGPSFVRVDSLEIWRDEQLVETLDVTGDPPVQLDTTVTLDPDTDAAYVFVATGEQGMDPVYPGRSPWAMTAALRVDGDGDGGWTPPKPPLTRE